MHQVYGDIYRCIRTTAYNDCVMTSIRLMHYSYLYEILVQVHEIRIFSWHTLMYTDHDTDLIHTSCHVIIYSVYDFAN